MYKNTYTSEKLELENSIAPEENNQEGIYFKGKFISAEFIKEIKTKY